MGVFLPRAPESDQVLIVMEIGYSLVIDVHVCIFTQRVCFVYCDLGSVYVILWLGRRGFKTCQSMRSDQVLIVIEIRSTLAVDVNVGVFTQRVCFVYCDLGSVYFVLRLYGRGFKTCQSIK